MFRLVNIRTLSLTDLVSQAAEAESVFQIWVAPDDSPNEDRIFEQSWAEALVDSALARVSADYDAEGQSELFKELKIFLTANADPLPTYDQLAQESGIPASTLRSHVTRLRTRYRAALQAEVRRTVASDAEIEASCGSCCEPDRTMKRPLLAFILSCRRSRIS